MIPYFRFEILSDTYLYIAHTRIRNYPAPHPHSEDFTCHVASKHGWDDECQVIHEFSDVKCCFDI